MSFRDGLEKVRELFRSNRHEQVARMPQYFLRDRGEGRVMDVPEEMQPPERPAAIPNDRYYKQWYDDDPERWSVESGAMSKRGFESGVLRDGRVCFVKKAQGEQNYDVAVICDWGYPQRPPSVFVERGDLGDELNRNPDGSVDVFANTMNWKPDMAAVTVIDYLEQKVGILREYKGLVLTETAK